MSRMIIEVRFFMAVVMQNGRWWRVDDGDGAASVGDGAIGLVRVGRYGEDLEMEKYPC